MHIVYAKLGKADAGDNEAKIMTKLSPECLNSGFELPLDYGARSTNVLGACRLYLQTADECILSSSDQIYK